MNEQKNEFLTTLLHLNPEEDRLWIAGLPRQVPERSNDELVVRVPLHPYAATTSGHIRRRDEAAASADLRMQATATTIRLTAVPRIPGLPVPEPLRSSAMLTADHREEPLLLTAMRPDAGATGGASAFTVVSADGVVRAEFRTEMPVTEHWSDLIAAGDPLLDLVLYPDGTTPVRVYGWDQFVPTWRDAAPLCFVQRGDRLARASVSLYAYHDERYAGTGERFLGADLSGRTLELVNVDALGVNSARAYKNVPFVLSSRGYGLFVHTSSPTTLSLKGISTRSSQVAVEASFLDLFVVGGGAPEPVLASYRRLTGFPPELPLWSYGMWMSRMTYFSASEIEEIAARLRAERFPCDVLHIDTGWFDKDWVCEWRFSDERFPDPAGFMRVLREQGFRVSLWQNPNIGGENRLLPHAVEHGFVPAPDHDADGSASGSDFSLTEINGQIDFSNPDAVAWYQGLLRDLFRMGASVIKTDFGEEIRMDVAYHGMSAHELRNLYGLLYQRAAFEETARATGEPVIWARAGWSGCQRYPVHWGGDAAASWDGLAGSLRGGLHLGLSGFGYWSHDVPGFHGVPDFMNTKPDDELYVRWTQFGVLSSHLRYHGTWPREPWHYPAVAHLVREWLKLRYALIPYLVKQGERVARSGMPMLRSLVFESPDDPVCWTIDDEYLLGDDLLVAPVMEPGGARDLYLPRGTWVDAFTGDATEGPLWVRGGRWELGRLPLYFRRGAAVPVYPREVQSTNEMNPNEAKAIVVDDSFTGLAATVLGSYIAL